MAGKVFLALAVALVAFAAFIQFRARSHEARAEAAYPPLGRIIEMGDGVRVHAVVMGEGPDLVLIHGASGNARDMTFGLAPRLAERYRVIVFDRPGLGYSTRINETGATIAQQADLLARAAAELGADRPIVMGQSYGGAVALAWAVHRPANIAALVPVSAPSIPWDTPLDPFYRVTSSRVGSALIVPMLTAFVPDARVAQTVRSIFAPQAVPEGYGAYVGAGLTLRRHTLRANADQRANLLDEIRELEPHYPRIAVPVELVHGSADTTVGLKIHSARLVDRIPGARLTVLEGIGHMPHHVAQDDVVAAIDRAAARAGLR
ncbi:MAG: alpha/beta hydrolase [Rhodobacteraceae bacterium]|nr:MAG: alpha/beta hydrolase [Paracoccaceae bacterium]